VKATEGRFEPKEKFMDTILVLDDDEANLQGIAEVLRSEHYSVLAASTGSQAVEAGKACGSLSLFVTDMDLPFSSGMDIAGKLLTSYPNLPVLFISGTPRLWWTHRNIATFKRFPPTSVDFIEKPFSLSQLLMRVQSLIGRPGGTVPKWGALDVASSATV
jgi:CheY-like chemotaxis protein